MFLHKVENDYFDVLTKKYIHPEQLTEKSRYSLSGDSVYVLDTIRNKINEKEMYVVLTITTSCNLACAYCFENGTIRHPINEKTLSEVIHNIEKYIIENGIKKLHCTLFGGEPLLEEQLVAKFTTVLHEFCKDNEILLTISMTTNGLIANKSLLEKLYQNSLTCVQVTFDGPKEMNNRRRRSRNISVKDPYTTILKNLNTFLSIFDTVNIKYNFDKQNLDEFDIFLNDLLEVVQPQYIGKIVILVEAIQGTHNSHYSYNYRNTDEELAKAYITIISKLVDANIKYRSKIFNTPCMATSSLDANAENLLYKKYRELSTKKISFFVSHRLASCIFCDSILVFDKGQIVQQGNHKTLINDTSGLYAQMFNLQAAQYK